MDVADRFDPERMLMLARAGDDQALGRLLEHYRSYLTVLARMQIGRRLQGKADPADLVQETFLEAHRSFQRFRGASEAELSGWLRQILGGKLAHLVRRYLGTKRRDVRLERELVGDLDHSSQALDHGLVARGSTPSVRVARRERAVMLANTLEQLPEDYREVLVLRHLEGLTFPDVALRMRRSLDSVEKLWVRALDRLRRKMDTGTL
jgi:RNA polymerase sigma-70 factor (ECF subfamily)